MFAYILFIALTQNNLKSTFAAVAQNVNNFSNDNIS